MIQLGFSGRILGDPRLRSHDSQRLASRPHLSVSLLLLRDVLAYLARHAVRLYRLPAGLAPYLTYGQDRRLLRQIEECAGELAELGAEAAGAGLRLTMHLDSSVVLSTPDEELAARSCREIEAQAALLRAFGSPEPVVVAHPGGLYDDRAAATRRCVRRLLSLSPPARETLALEHDGRLWSLSDLFAIHSQTGVRLVFDHLHHQLYNPSRLPLAAALRLALATWPPAQTPKIHFSSPRTELRIGVTGAGGARLDEPGWHEHSDYAHPFELISLLRQPTGRPYAVMLEAKAGDLALLRARADIAGFAPELAGRIA